MNLEQMQADYDWSEAMKIAKAPYGVVGYSGSLAFSGWQDIAEIIAYDAGENDGANWIAAFRLHDGRYLFLAAGCDYTGWDCQAGGFTQLAATLDDLIRLAMGREDRVRLGYPDMPIRIAV